MKVLVTGGAGYVGSLLIPMLLEKGHKVTLFDKFVYGIEPALPFLSRVELVEKDIRDSEAVKKAVRAVDCIIHLAAIVGFPACGKDEKLAHDVNVEGTRNVVDAVSSSDQMLIYASTGSTYGIVDGEVCTEKTPISPLTVYGRTKAQAERMALNLGGISLRFATVFGVSPRMRLDLLVNDFVYQACHNGYIVIYEAGHRRTFIHAIDAARAYMFTIEHFKEMSSDQVYNVGNRDLNMNKKDVALAVREQKDYYLHEADVGTDPDKRNYEVDYSKLYRLGFKAQYSMADGIRELLRVIPSMKIECRWRNA